MSREFAHLLCGVGGFIRRAASRLCMRRVEMFGTALDLVGLKKLSELATEALVQKIAHEERMRWN